MIRTWLKRESDLPNLRGEHHDVAGGEKKTQPHQLLLWSKIPGRHWFYWLWSSDSDLVSEGFQTCFPACLVGFMSQSSCLNPCLNWYGRQGSGSAKYKQPCLWCLTAAMQSHSPGNQTKGSPATACGWLPGHQRDADSQWSFQAVL